MSYSKSDAPCVVRDPGESFEGMLARFVRRTRACGVVAEFKRRRAFVGPSEERRLARLRARRRTRRAA